MLELLPSLLLDCVSVTLLDEYSVLEDENSSQTAVNVVLLLTKSVAKSHNLPNKSLNHPKNVKPSFVGLEGLVTRLPSGIVCSSTFEPPLLLKVIV